MSRVRSIAPVPVRLGDCQCAGSPHDGQDGRDDGDIVWLRPRLGIEAGLAASAALSHGETNEQISRDLGMVWVLHGVTRWNFLDDDGSPIPVSEDVIRFGLDWGDTIKPIAEAANDLYSEEFLRPLLVRASRPSQPGQTAGSTSATTSSSAPRRKPSRRSSRGTSAGMRPSAG